MAKSVPRREIDELAKRWSLAKLPSLVVEGPSDARFVKLLQKHSTLPPKFKSLDVFHLELVNIPGELVAQYGFEGTGSKQRLVTFGMQVDAKGVGDGFRCIIDKDLDPFLGKDHHTATIVYTDGSCMESYSWTVHTFAKLVEICKCETAIADGAIAELYKSITDACRAVLAVRLVNERNRAWAIGLHTADPVLNLADGRLTLDLTGYVNRCAPAKGTMAEVKAAVTDAQAEIKDAALKDVIHGHDLVWLVTFVLKETTELPRTALSQEFVAAALATVGARDAAIDDAAMFGGLSTWAEGVA